MRCSISLKSYDQKNNITPLLGEVIYCMIMLRNAEQLEGAAVHTGSPMHDVLDGFTNEGAP